MILPHPLGAHVSLQASAESVSPGFIVAGLLHARERTLKVLDEVRSSLREGMTEDDARRMALKIFLDHGVSKHWHKPYIRFGAGTTLTFHEPLQPDYRLREGDPYYIDLGPVWADRESGLEYEGDYGDTFVLGSNGEAEACAAAARELFAEARGEWRKGGVSGEALYRLLRRRAVELGYDMVEKVDGHRVGDFPHMKHSKERLAKTQFIPSESLWVLEIQINDRAGRFGAFFEDLL